MDVQHVCTSRKGDVTHFHNSGQSRIDWTSLEHIACCLHTGTLRSSIYLPNNLAMTFSHTCIFTAMQSLVESKCSNRRSFICHVSSCVSSTPRFSSLWNSTGFDSFKKSCTNASPALYSLLCLQQPLVIHLLPARWQAPQRQHFHAIRIEISLRGRLCALASALAQQPPLPGPLDDIPDAVLALRSRGRSRSRCLVLGRWHTAEHGGDLSQPRVPAQFRQGDALGRVWPEDARQQVLHLKRQRQVARQVVPAYISIEQGSGTEFEESKVSKGRTERMYAGAILSGTTSCKTILLCQQSRRRVLNDIKH